MTERITKALEIKSLIEDDKYHIFEGIAYNLNSIDLDEDIIKPGAFLKSIEKTQEVPILWQHDWSEPIGVSFELKESEDKFLLKGKLPKDDSFVKSRVMPQLNIRSVKKMSIGFSMNSGDYEYHENSNLRVISNLDLKEVSLVTFPADPEADITSVKSIPEFQSIKDIEKFLRSDCGLSRKLSETFLSKSKSFLINQGDPGDQKNKDQSDPDLIKRLEEVKNQINLMSIKECLKKLK